jgi:hypothetical protein
MLIGHSILLRIKCGLCELTFCARSTYKRHYKAKHFNESLGETAGQQMINLGLIEKPSPELFKMRESKFLLLFLLKIIFDSIFQQ